MEGKGLYTRAKVPTYFDDEEEQTKTIHAICGLLCDQYEIPDMTTMEFVYSQPDVDNTEEEAMKDENE